MQENLCEQNNISDGLPDVGSVLLVLASKSLLNLCQTVCGKSSPRAEINPLNIVEDNFPHVILLRTLTICSHFIRMNSNTIFAG